MVRTIKLHISSNIKNTTFWFKTIRKRTKRLIDSSTHLIGETIQRKARQHIHDRARWRHTGELAASVHLTSYAKSEMRGRVSLTVLAPYGTFVEEGTKPHEVPTNPMWGMRGRIHPGARPMHFMRDAFNDTVPLIDELVAMASVKVGWFN